MATKTNMVSSFMRDGRERRYLATNFPLNRHSRLRESVPNGFGQVGADNRSTEPVRLYASVAQDHGYMISDGSLTVKQALFLGRCWNSLWRTR